MVQRVRRAAVRVDGLMIGQIDLGLLVYVGAGRGDGPLDAKALAEKVAFLRVFPDGRLPLNRSVLDVGGAVLVVSQFTLLGDCRRGRRPSFSDALDPAEAESLIATFTRELQGRGASTMTGRFGAMMDVESLNWGPVTILLDSKKVF